MTDITPDGVRELLKAATPGPWKERAVDHFGDEPLVDIPMPQRNYPLFLAAPEIAAAYLELAEKETTKL